MDFSATNVFIESLFDDNGMFDDSNEVGKSVSSFDCDAYDVVDDEVAGVPTNDAVDDEVAGVPTMQYDEVAGDPTVQYDPNPIAFSIMVSGNGNNVVPDEVGSDGDCKWIPSKGETVQNIIEGFVKYSEYAKRVGFEVRFRSSELSKKGKKALGGASRRMRNKRGLSRNWFFGDHENCSRVRLRCVKGEKCRPNRRNPERAVLTQATGCMAGVSLVNEGDGTWIFKTVQLDHNHECNPAQTRYMKNYRLISSADEKQIVTGDRAGVAASRMFMTFAVGKGGIDKVPFSIKDCHSVISRWRSKNLDNGDFNAMQELFNEMRSLQEEFFYLYDTDSDGRVKNVFWADGRSRAAYKDFGDVVSFDTTHLKNRYKMPLAPFIGVNHHGQSILLGCALVSKEDAESFSWVFDAWMKCMHNIPPKFIMTDQCKAIGKAISESFPNSRHRWCLWHVMRNGERQLKRIEGWNHIRKALKEAVYDARNSLEFEGMWNNFIIKYNLEGNDWLRSMYEVKERWVPAYFLDEFWAGLHSTQRSEGMNNFFRGYVNINTGLRQFAEQYCLAAGKRVDDEEWENWKSMNKPALCATRFPSERILQSLYTVKKFLEFQNEAKGVGYTKIESLPSYDDRVNNYNVIDRGVEKVYGAIVTRNYVVSYDTETNDTECDCKMFSFRGIICRHMVAVWQDVDLKVVPERYVVNRWRKDIARECSLVKVPKYSSAIDRTSDFRKLEQLQDIMRDISVMSLGSDELFNDVLTRLNKVREKCVGFVCKAGDLCVDSVGRLYKRNCEDDSEDVAPMNSVDNVLDPVDRRGKGRVPTHRKGYGNDKRKRQKSIVHGDAQRTDGTIEHTVVVPSSNQVESMGEIGMLSNSFVSGIRLRGGWTCGSSHVYWA